MEKRRPSRKLALETNGVWEIHATSQTGSYPTLCGRDNEESSSTDAPDGALIDCQQCISLFVEVQRYQTKDFDQKCLKAVVGTVT